MTRTLFLRVALIFLMLLATASTAFAQAPYAIRIDGSEMDGERLSFATLVRGLHVLAPGEEEPREIVLFSALIVDDEVLAMGQSPFLAAPVEGEVREGVTLRDARIELDRAYRERRAEMSIVADLFVPTNLVGGDDAEISGGMFIPGGMWIPGCMLSPRDDIDAEREEGTMRTGDQFIGGVVEFSSRRPDSEQLIRMARRMSPEAREAGEPFLIFFVTDPENMSLETEVVGLLRASWR